MHTVGLRDGLFNGGLMEVVIPLCFLTFRALSSPVTATKLQPVRHTKIRYISIAVSIADMTTCFTASSQQSARTP